MPDKSLENYRATKVVPSDGLYALASFKLVDRNL